MTDVPEKPLVVFGAAQMAEIAAYYFTREAGRAVAAFTVDDPSAAPETFCGCPVVGVGEVADRFPPATHDAFVAIGYSKLNAVRRAKCEALRALGYRLASFVSPRAYVAGNAAHGDNCLILEHNTVQPFVRIGDGVTLWSGNHIGHHSIIGDYAFVSSHVVVSGNCTVGEACFLGVNSALNDGVTLGARCVLGSGSLVVKDVEAEGVLSAEPAALSRVPSSRLRGF